MPVAIVRTVMPDRRGTGGAAASSLVARALVAWALVACSAPPPPPAPRADLLAGADPAAFPGAGSVLAGFDPFADTDDLRVGDRCLLGFSFRNGDVERRWLLDFDVIEADLGGAPNPVPHGVEVSFTITRNWYVSMGGRPFQVSSRLCRVRMRVRDDDGRELGSSVLELPRDFLEIGFLPGCRAAQAWKGTAGAAVEPTAALAKELVGPVIAMMQLLQVVQHDQTLAPFFWQVVRTPGLWSVITSLGVSTNLNIDSQAAIQAGSGPAHLAWCGESWVLPMTVEVNGAPALYCQFLVGRAAPPLTPIGGILGAEGHHPSDPTCWFELVLLAARRGPVAGPPAGQ